jgi:methyl-accepting chemotaxis protein
MSVMSNAPAPVIRVATGLAQGDGEHVANALIEQVRAKLGGAAPAFVGLFASTAQPLDDIAPRVAAAFPGAALVGSSTAGEFTERGDAKSAASIFAVAGDLRASAGLGVGLAADPERAVTEALSGLPAAVAGYPHRTAVLLLDPLAGNGEEATLIAASILGQGVGLAGGAAGDDLAMRRTLVSCGARTASDAVVVALLYTRAPLGVGVCHGHAPLSRPLRVTRAEGGVVYTIEGRPAWDVWLDETRAHVRAAGGDVDAMPRDLEGGYLLRYEAGLAASGHVGGGAESHAGTETYKIRAPLSRGDDGSIHFACGIPEGSVIRITESDGTRQVASAREAARRARARLGGTTQGGAAPAVAGALVFDCICRNLILGEDFSRAVRGMSEELGGAPLAGFETYGEIALDAGDMSGFHNTTSVVLAFPAD